MFHEPGPEVRGESLAILEEMRWPGGRKRLETRHAEEVVKASMRHQVEEEKRLADGAATKVQEAYRNKMGATRRGEDQEAPSEQGEAVGEADPEASQGEERDDASVLIFEISFAVTPASCNATARLETRRPIFHLTATVTLLSISR